VKWDEYTLYRPSDVAAITGVSVSSIYRLVRSGQLGHFFVESKGGAIRIPGMFVERLLAHELDLAMSTPVGPLAEGAE
jgi:excisionase family DNA binding protein